MKRLAVTLFITVLALGSVAQKGNLGDKPEECTKYLSLYGDYLSQKLYADAYKFWIKAVEVCPEYNSNLYDNGVYIMSQLKRKATKERKKTLTDSIIWAYEQNIKFFGENPKINENFGADLIKSGKVSKGVDLIEKALDSSQNTVRASSIYYYANALAVLKNKDKKDCEVLVEEYDRLSQVIEFNKGKNGYDKAQDAIDKYLGPCLTCDKLLPVIQKKFEQAKTDDELRNKVLSTLKKRGCTDNEVYETLTLISCQKDPNSDCYEMLGGVEFAKGNFSKAIEYFDKAIELTDDKARKESLTINAAKILLKNKQGSKAGAYADKALSLNSSNGDAYLIKASLIARSRCGTSAFDDAAINWAAYDMAAKAKNIDPSVSSEASKAMSSYRARFPTKQQKFENGVKDGQSFKTCNGYSTTVK